MTHKPFNPEIHQHLLALGYGWTHHEESFEDDGDAENGPHLTGGPAWDEYSGNGEYIVIVSGGHVAHRERESESPDLEPPEFFYASEHGPSPDFEITEEKMREIARGNIERHIGDVCEGEESADSIYDEAFLLAFDALADAGVEHGKARAIAEELASGFASP